MCGIAGVISPHDSVRSGDLRETIQQMTDALTRRGPDDGGIWASDDQVVALGHRRLSVLELSDLGHQPMVSSSDRYVLTFNGEIYNFVEIAGQLTKYRNDVIATSDTRVMLAAFEQWGVVDAVKRFDGMFAFLCFDRQKNRLHAVRDRLGEKPLYFGCHEGKILFASELKAMQAVFRRKPELDKRALTLFLRHGYIPSPYSIYQNIFKLTPASMLSLDLDVAQQYVNDPTGLPRLPVRYWKLGRPAYCPRVTQADFDQILTDAVERQMRSDVPLGAFLSGGVDSSLIVALMQRTSSRPVRTFSIGFEREALNEAPYAREVARHLKTDHHERILTAKEVMKAIPDLANVYDEPFADSSQLPTLLVSQVAREQVTVCLSGDGGDELFGGYERYRWAQRIWNTFSWMPSRGRKAMCKMVLRGMGLFEGPLSFVKHNTHLARLSRVASMLTEAERQQFYRVLLSAERHPERYVVDGGDPEYGLTRLGLEGDHFLHQMMYLDIHNYLPDDILTKVDRASMHSSLELRAPLLDHHVVEAAWGLRNIALDGGSRKTKSVLRQLLYQSVPRELIERPKRGFAVPLDEWLRGPLRQWSESYLNHDRLKQSGLFQSDAVMLTWNNFLKGKPGSQHFLWNVLMFELWRETWG